MMAERAALATADAATPVRAFSRPCIFGVASAVAAIIATVPADAFELPSDWISEHFRDHPLVGTIRTASGESVAAENLARDVAKADFLLLGETHDNADHHILQARLVETLLDAGRKPSVVFEMIPTDLQTTLDAYLAASEPDAAGFGAAVRWDERGWPDYAFYQPIVEVALQAGLTIRAGDLPRETIRSVGREGIEALPEAERARLFLDRPMPEPQAAELSAELKVSHCGMLPDHAVPPMLAAQRARDGALADALITAARDADGGGAVLIAGSGHVRTDRAVPALLATRNSSASIVSIALMEVAEGDDAPEDYGLSPASPAPYDYVLFTPQADVSDPCEGMAEAMGRTSPAQ